MSDALSFIRNTTWTEVLSDWRAREAGFGWEEHYRAKGFDNWDDWRKTFWEKGKLDMREWVLVKVIDPSEFVPSLWAVAFAGWKKYYPQGQDRARIIEIVKSPLLPKNGKVKALQADFPKQTTMIVLQCGEDYALFEGMHRASTVTLASSRGERIETDLTVALTILSEDERPLFEKAITQN